ncbi:MAG: 2-oxoacid:acceptor oxidoreductase family protein [Candidatus Methanomethylophilaceae archaeon]|nr:2-oxoacid:acceptor oxidoreductase family protein [Candidatus Methanomethylophilaceae archaeon]
MTEKRIEIVWHGRGGQGAFTAARIVGAAYALGKEGRYAMSFPSFGPERRGAPVRAFTKLSTAPINDRSQVSHPDFSVYLDEGLFPRRSPASGIALVNSKEDFGLDGVVSFDASGLAQSMLGVPITNTVMAGVLGSFVEGLDPQALSVGVDACMPPRLRQKNLAVMEKAYSEMAVGQ